MCYMCYMGLTRQAAEPPLPPSSMLYVLYVLYYSVRALKYTICAIQCIFGTCWRCYVYSIQACHIAHMGPYSTYSTYSMELGESQRIDHIAARRPTVRLWARRPHEPGKGAVPERGACNDLYAFGRASAWSVPSKGRPPCRELLAVVQGPQTLRHGDRLVGPELSSRTESLTHCAVTSTRMQRFSTARVSASKTLSSGERATQTLRA